MKTTVYFDLPLRFSRILLTAYLFCGLTLLIWWVSVDLPLTLSCFVGGLFVYSVFVICVRLKRLSQVQQMRLDSTGLWVWRGAGKESVDSLQIAYVSRWLVILSCTLSNTRSGLGSLWAEKLHLIVLPDSIATNKMAGESPLRPLFVAITTGRLRKCIAQPSKKITSS
ncbi:hypothetical protein QFX18_09360 [Saccharophagus degradans]|uniref:hypothetical protein n=1 Tax=Saccharophagus degradans TaxID=86304 RepID=UPI002477D3EC|nr:hypothetical protein [Saccharophagus degradans]WGP00253.1 hypothetical protein QFX18_09360 [Saccharophagus degradans]